MKRWLLAFWGNLRLSTVLVLTAFGAHAQVHTPVGLQMPQSHEPLGPYMPDRLPEPILANSARLDSLIRDGTLYLSLRDAIDLALENNLDLAIARYNLPIADTDVLRTEAGGSFRGVNTGVVQGTPGGGVGGYGAGAQESAPVALRSARAERAQATLD